MIVALDGLIAKKEATKIFIKTNCGVTYEVFISLSCSSKISQKNIELKIVEISKDDGNFLYGFLDDAEKAIFEKVIKISGIGPSTAMALLSSLTPADFQKAIVSQDIDLLKKAPGIGPKTAKRILVELSDFSPLAATVESRAKNEALMALESLGFKKESILKVLGECTSEETSSIIKEALKKLTS